MIRNPDPNSPNHVIYTAELRAYNDADFIKAIIPAGSLLGSLRVYWRFRNFVRNSLSIANFVWVLHRVPASVWWLHCAPVDGESERKVAPRIYVSHVRSGRHALGAWQLVCSPNVIFINCSLYSILDMCLLLLIIHIFTTFTKNLWWDRVLQV